MASSRRYRRLHFSPARPARPTRVTHCPARRDGQNPRTLVGNTLIGGSALRIPDSVSPRFGPAAARSAGDPVGSPHVSIREGTKSTRRGIVGAQPSGQPNHTAGESIRPTSAGHDTRALRLGRSNRIRRVRSLAGQTRRSASNRREATRRITPQRFQRLGRHPPSYRRHPLQLRLPEPLRCPCRSVRCSGGSRSHGPRASRRPSRRSGPR